ncbi:MAG: peptidoglycan-binding protein [Clostridiales bacterium]|nr:peptidoglycan-binding protein [Clostridiales bacterium]
MFFKKLFSIALCAVLALSTVAVCAVSANALTPTYDCSASYKTSRYYQDLLKVKLTGKCADDIVNVAKSQVGYHEGDGNTDLDGSGVRIDLIEGGNFTEYGYFFSKGKSGYGSWCAYFVNWCARQAGISANILYDKDGYVKNILRHYKNGINGTWYKGPYYGGTYVPQKGDIAIIDFDHDYNGGDHICIVARDAKDLSYIETIGGNEFDSVCEGTFTADIEGQRNTDTIVGFFHPDYYKNSYVDDPTHPDNYDAPTTTLKTGSKGSGVKFVQAVLFRLGYLTKKTDIDGVYGAGTATAVTRYQTAKKIGVDGIVGPATLKKICEDWDRLYAEMEKNGKKAELPVVVESEFTHSFVGDVNCDDEINLMDVTELQKVLAKLTNEDSFGPVSQLDANCDNDITMEDVVILQKHIAGLINIF